ncbi:MAG: 2-hydroxycarboxylate transporter family protein [Sweet potato little leaf phytoplasma]|uniref:2-hydroxycarboxylate transporter family protein n=4 Tax=Candidatus Phytoplasma TaxID=33926 RepID=A0A9K3SSZ8_9MOLU|nr:MULTISPECIES: 2-hydroxycarboxylate transporter family protein [Phytoplasma]QLL37020.1 malate/citrate symporter ['Echinacea purpurea' witches'-broom phytoplasma]WEX20260.1 MAG: malate/citrate symporter [Candidatus Phytoplasma aurantifolia]EMR14592.1 malate/citrate symporter [Peanut witches'-broom phytoplasma NTU2011]MCG3566799.1 2-hydroxycarboxylate transporter family protein [Sesame phyllody phytoplasma]MDO7987242.1 2-hydroxycarboxylate transporter family protein [Sweet potato little leaf p
MNINSSINDSTFNPHKKPKLKILGFSIEFALLLLSISIMHIWISYDATKGQFNSSWHNLISVLLFTMILAEILKVIGKKIPILKDMGGGAIFCLLLPAFLFNYNFFPRNFETSLMQFQSAFRERISFFNKNSNIGFSEFFVASLVCGSLLSIDKFILKKNGPKFLFLVILSLICSGLVTGLLGIFLKPIGGIDSVPGSHRNSFLDAIFFIFVPISCGGLTCGIIPLIKVFSQGIVRFEDAFKNHIITSLLIGGILSVMFGGLIKKIFGNSEYSSPEGELDKNINKLSNNKFNHLENEKKDNNSNLSFLNMKMGLLMIFSLYALSSIFRTLLLKLWPSTNLEKYIPPTIIFLVILVLLIKFFDLISDNYIQYINQASKFITQSFSSCILVVVGININILMIINRISNLSFLFTCIACVLTTALTSAIIGNKMGYYPVQASIAAGLCANSIGGAGNLAILEASDSLELSPYAQISTRLGGDLTVIVASIFFPLFYFIN